MSLVLISLSHARISHHENASLIQGEESPRLNSKSAGLQPQSVHFQTNNLEKGMNTFIATD